MTNQDDRDRGAKDYPATNPLNRYGIPSDGHIEIADTEAPTKPDAEPKPELHTPAEWALKLGLIERRDPRRPQTVDNAHHSHAAADQLYEWSRHAYDYQADPFLLSEADYRKALEAAVQYPVATPHAAALPPSRKDKFKDFVPRKAREKR